MYEKPIALLFFFADFAIPFMKEVNNLEAIIIFLIVAFCLGLLMISGIAIGILKMIWEGVKSIMKFIFK